MPDFSHAMDALNSWGNALAESEIRTAEVKALEAGTVFGAETEGDPQRYIGTSRAGAAFNKASLNAYLPRVENEVNTTVSHVTQQWENGEYGDDVGQVKSAFTKMQRELMTGLNAQTKALVAPRIEAKFNDALTRINADYFRKDKSRKLGEFNVAVENSRTEALGYAKNGDVVGAQSALASISAMTDDAVSGNIVDPAKGAELLKGVLDDVVLETHAADIYEDFTATRVIEFAAMDIPDVSPEKKGAMVSRLLSELGRKQSIAKAAETAEKALIDSDEKTWEASVSQMIYRGGADRTAIEQKIADYELLGHGKFPAEAARRLRSDFETFQTRKNNIYPDNNVLLDAKLQIRSSDADPETLRNWLDSKFQASINSGSGLDYGSYQSMLAEVDKLEADMEAVDKTLLSNAKQVLSMAMGVSLTDEGILSNMAMFSQDKQTKRKNMMALDEFYTRVRDEDKSPVLIAREVIEKYDLTEGFNAEGVTPEDTVYKKNSVGDPIIDREATKANITKKAIAEGWSNERYQRTLLESGFQTSDYTDLRD